MDITIKYADELALGQLLGLLDIKSSYGILDEKLKSIVLYYPTSWKYDRVEFIIEKLKNYRILKGLMINALEANSQICFCDFPNSHCAKCTHQEIYYNAIGKIDKKISLQIIDENYFKKELYRKEIQKNLSEIKH